MFHLYQSHSLHKLAQHFSDAFEPASRNPLSQPWVIVQNNEIKEWLSLEFARKQGIAGNFRFIFPSEFLWVLYRLKNNEIPEMLPGDLNAMQWALFELFAEQPGLLREIPFYSMESDSPQKRFQLCGRLADNFDQYQVYRPHMPEAWLRGKLVTRHKDEKWQAVLWKKLNTRWQAAPDTSGIPRRSQAFTELMEWLKTGDEFAHEIPGSIYVFGLSHAPKPFLEIISQLGKQKEVHYFFRGNEKSAGDTGVKLPEDLRNTWSKPQQQHLSLIRELTKKYDCELSEEYLKLVPSQTLVQLAVHACHNKRREAEVLKDQILYFLDENPDCGAGDILVMVPDADEYAGILEMVFENDRDEPGLPVARLGGMNRQSAEHTLSELLELLSGTFKAGSVMQFLHLEPVRKQFSFSDTELDLLENWLLENHVFRGLGEEFNTSYSWQKGLNQLFAGFSLEPGRLEVFRGLIPYNQLASSDDAALSARFSRFVHALKKNTSQLGYPKTIVDWMSFAENLVHGFIGEQEGGAGQKSRLFVQLNKLKEQAALAKPEQAVPYGLMKTWLQGQLNTQHSGSARYGQGVTVSSYIPYRSVPFAFIGVLGMNEGVFPRKAIRPDYDLIYAAPEAGDRILKEDDTYLFLETLEAADRHLHLSFQGKDLRTDATRLPSILIQQLLEGIESPAGNEIVRHSLHAFNKRYFSEGGLLSYSGSNKTLAEKMEDEAESLHAFITKNLEVEREESTNNIQVQDIISFFVHPCKYFLQNQLDIRDYDDFNELVDREQFRLSGLEKYKLDDLLMEFRSRGESVEQVFEYAQSVPLIPEAMEGEKAFELEKKKMDALHQMVNEHTGGERTSETIDIEIEVEGTRITGAISGLYGDKLVLYRAGKRHEKHEIELWLKQLMLLQAAVPVSESLFISMDGSVTDVLRIPSAKVLENPLADYLCWFLEKDLLPGKLAFFQKSSKAYAGKFLETQNTEAALGEADKQWKMTQYNQWADSADFYNQLVWRHKNPLMEESFRDNAVRFWKPFWDASRMEETQ